MTRVLVTGMSGSGKTSLIRELARRGFAAIDTDDDEWCEWTLDDDGQPDWTWRPDAITRLLQAPRPNPLFLGGCKTNQGSFYPLLDHVVLLTAPLDVLLKRVATRTNNPYGHRPEERDEIAHYKHTVEPLLRRRATFELDTSELTVADVADQVLAETRTRS